MTDSSEESSEGEPGFWGEDGQWHDNESKPAPLSEEQRIYGIWSDSNPFLPPRQKRRTNKYKSSVNSTLHFSFVSGGVQTVDEQAIKDTIQD